ncbi:MAG TPA: hypothetical protein VN854_00935, partial [Mycoplasmatales bacterium]|nr:hypothetical protein [Mycoplasmatales bacterium]
MVNEFFNEFFVKDKIEKSSSDFYFESSLLIESLSGKISEYGEITRNLRNKIKCLKIEIKDLKYKAEIKELRNNNINLDSGYDSSSKFSTPLSSQPTSPRSKRNLGRFARSNSIDSTLSNPYSNPLFNQIIQQVINKVDKYGEGILDKILNSLNLIGKKINLRDICSNNHDREIISFFDKNNSNLGEESDNCSKLNKEILAGLFEDFDTSNKKMEISNYNFGERVLNLDLSLKEWLNNEFKIGSFTFNNKRFNPKTITSDYKLFLGTGTGKSTFLPRCIAAHNNGCTIVVHDDYLVGSILHAHNKWLSKGNLNPSEENYDERVINCPICGENHSKIEDGQKRAYETIHNGPSKSINVFTWNNFVSALCDSEKREWIKQVVIFDEAHVDYPYYKETIELFTSYRDKLNKDYKIIQTSATFSDLPSSLILKGKINDFYVNPEKIREFCEKNPGFLNKKIVIFCSEFSKLNFKILDDNKIKYLVLNEDLKDFASEMTRSTDAKLVIADSSYSMGLSPGDVNVISTGISHLENVIKNENGDFKFEKVTLESSF